MVVLKQVLITVAAAAAGVLASPLFPDAPATTAVGTSEPAHRNDTDLGTLSGPCDQGNCPDFNAPFDFLAQNVMTYTGAGYLPLWVYYGRWNDCGQCGKKQISGDGCFDYTACGRPQSVCIDLDKHRAHRIWKDNGDKTCYRTKLDSYGKCNAVLVGSYIEHPTQQVACTW
ncbi:hypothetical protein VTK26DRAFT_8150 [Humicola hyalothermophila]